MASALSRWEPFAELADLRARLDQMFTEFAPRGEHRFVPAIDVVRSNGNLVLKADLPGIKANEVTIEVEDDVLTVRGEHGEEHEEKRGQYMRRERRWGSFQRSMPLPDGSGSDTDRGENPRRSARGDRPPARGADLEGSEDQGHRGVTRRPGLTGGRPPALDAAPHADRLQRRPAAGH